MTSTIILELSSQMTRGTCIALNLSAQLAILTAHIRMMGEGTVFSLSVHTSTGGGGRVPHLADGGGTPSQVWTGGVPCPRSGQGVPHLGNRGVPHPADVVPPSPVWMGGGYPIQDQDGGVPWGIQ